MEIEQKQRVIGILVFTTLVVLTLPFLLPHLLYKSHHSTLAVLSSEHASTMAQLMPEVFSLKTLAPNKYNNSQEKHQSPLRLASPFVSNASSKSSAPRKRFPPKALPTLGEKRAAAAIALSLHRAPKTGRSSVQHVPHPSHTTLAPSKSPQALSTRSALPAPPVPSATHTVAPPQLFALSTLTTPDTAPTPTIAQRLPRTANMPNMTSHPIARTRSSKDVHATRTTPFSPWSVQLGTFSHPGNVLALIHRLHKNKFTAVYTQPVQTASGQMTRVFVGPVQNYTQAKRLLLVLYREVHLKGLLLPYRPVTTTTTVMRFHLTKDLLAKQPVSGSARVP